MRIERLRTNHLENPLGFFMEQISLSWVVTQARGTRAVKARIEVSQSETFERCVFDSGERDDLNSLDYRLPIKPKAGTRYYWRVRVWDEMGDQGSGTAYFETPVSLTRAAWITAPFSQRIHPLFRRRLKLTEPIRRARLYICGLGLYEAYLNGEKVGAEYLAPFYNDYNLWLQYQTYDVTKQLLEGENVLGVMLGNGWYKGRFGFVDQMDQLYGDTFRLIAELHLTYESGRSEVIATDVRWLCAPSPVAESSIYDGEIWDSRKEIQDWAAASGSEEAFEQARVIDGPTRLLTPRLSLPVKIMKTIQPIALLETHAGEHVLDFDQNMTGWVEFACKEPEGAEIYFQFGELLQEGNFYNENLRTAKAEFRYISNGRRAVVRPHFTFYGFRYLKVTGITEIKLENFTGCVIHSQMEQSGTITTSNPKVNRLFLNALWGQRGNFLDTPTDCPQRDERMGWTGDAQVFAATASYNMETAAFFDKYLHDMRLEQDTLAGGVPHVVPDILGQIDRKLRSDGIVSDNVAVSSAHSSCAWGDAATIIPWTLYLYYGDRTALRVHYPNMKKWTDYIRRVDIERCGGRYLWTDGFHFADWLALDNFHKDSCFGATDPYYVASVYYYYSASLTAKAARVLGEEKDAAYYEELAGQIKQAIREEFFTATGRLAADTQTGLVLALWFDLAPEAHRERLVQSLRDKLNEEAIHLTTGFVGTPFLCPALTKAGLVKEAYTLLLNEDYPSWLYEVNMGATTIWERWNSVLADGSISDTGMNSLNHYSYGSIVEWMYRFMCGLSACEEAPGYRRFLIQPYPDERFEWVSMEYHSAMGRIKSGFRKTEQGYEFDLEVPFDTEAEFVLTMDCFRVLLDGTKTGIQKAGESIRLQKGSYTVAVELPKQ